MDSRWIPVSVRYVSLLVRLWVEMKFKASCIVTKLSASLWGCELKYNWCCKLWQRRKVSLLVRLWVEIFCTMYQIKTSRVSLLVRLWVEMALPPHIFLYFPSASLWGCELKCFVLLPFVAVLGQPPCEAVSWNIFSFILIFHGYSQPPCEAVSWNIADQTGKWSYLQSASLWGCELK